jgi:hypothetical protein
MIRAILLVLLAVPAAADEQRPRPTDSVPIRIHPWALAQLRNELHGHEISLPEAKVSAVITPRAFLVEWPGALPLTSGTLHRVVVLINDGTLYVEPASLVGTFVRVTGIVRSLLGVQVTGEVPWPTDLTRDIVRRYGIRTAIFSSSVQTLEGVSLTLPRSGDETATADDGNHE